MTPGVGVIHIYRKGNIPKNVELEILALYM